MARPVLPGLLVIGAGILALLGGLISVGTGGYGGEAGAATGGLIILVGFLIPLWPQHKEALAFVAFVLAIPMIIWALAGIVVGLFLLLLGGILAFVWVPPPPNSRPRRGA